VHILRLLIDRGADILPDGWLFLMHALLLTHLEVAQLLLERGVPTGDAFFQHLQQCPGGVGGMLQSCTTRFGKHQSAALLEAALRHGHTQFAQLWGQAHAAVHGGDCVAGQLQAS
jgi:hypothetical protein